MQTPVKTARGLRLLVDLNLDRIFYLAAIVALLSASAWVRSLITVLRTTVGQPV